MIKEVTLAVAILSLALATGLNGPPLKQCQSGQVLTRGDIEAIKGNLGSVVAGVTIANVVRLVYHDCVDGCDGCMNKNNPENQPGGFMLQTTALLDQLYDNNNYSSLLTRADFYVLSAIYGLEEAVENANQGCQGSDCLVLPDIDFEFCRQDCPTSPDTTKMLDFADAHSNHSQVIDYFAREFGLTPRQSVALMGAHSLGGAFDSGFRGYFKGSRTESIKFNNNYYKALVDNKLDWIHVDASRRSGTSTPRWQWEAYNDQGKKVAFNLNADVSLFLDITTLPDGQSTCTFDTPCNKAPTANIVRQYAANGNLWLQDFVEAFQIMIRRGNENSLVKVVKK